MTLLCIRTGKVREYREADQAWTSAIEKVPVMGQVTLSEQGILGDEHADRMSHGGPDKAILCYSREHYARWSDELGSAAPAEGTLGENFEVGGTHEEEMCVGDIIQIGETILQVSQPRQPCWKPAKHHRYPQLTARILKSGRTGWYLRVLQGGTIIAPQPLKLVSRSHPEWTVGRATRVMHFEKDATLRRELAGLSALSTAWKTTLREKTGD